MNQKPTAEIRRYWTALTEDGCCICKAPAEIAHCHSGSIVERMQEPKAKGVKLLRYHWLVLPLCPPHGRDTYPTGLDRNVEEWESIYGTQADWIGRMEERTGIDAWAKARALMKPAPGRIAA